MICGQPIQDRPGNARTYIPTDPDLEPEPVQVD